MYILSIISLISKFRKTNTYKLVNWIIKIILALNIIFVSGLFVTLIDFETPFDTVYNLYMDLLSPYIEIIKAKFNLLLKIINSVDEMSDKPFDMQPFELLNKQYRSNPLPIDNNPIDVVSDDISFTFADIAFYAGIGFFAYFFLYLPGLNNVSPTELAQYSYLNQALIEIKMGAKDIIINLLFGNSGGNPPANPPIDSVPGTPNTPGINLSDARTISSGSDATVTGNRVISPVDSHSPSPFNSPMPRTPRDLARLSEVGITSPNSDLSPSELDHYFAPTATQEASIQTVITHTNLVNLVIRNLVDKGVQTINTGINASVQADSPSKLLNSIQLLNDNVHSTEID